MTKKVILVILLVFSLLLASCYPELSVQQYDKLKTDLAALDTERQELREQVAGLEAKHAESLAYLKFLEKLTATQTSEKILSGQFDTNSLVKAKEDLTSLANNLGDNEIVYFLGLIKPDNDSQTIAAYNKTIQYSLKKIKQGLE